jgi:hypothetical protein
MFSKQNAAKILFILVVGSSVAFPLIASAYTTPNLWPTGFWGPLVSCTGNYLSNPAGNTTPCQNLCDLINTVINIIYFILSIAIFIVTPISFVIGAIMIMMGGANPEMLGKGKKVMAGTVIGLIIVLCSYLIVATFVKALNITNIGGFGGPACTSD